ncbi:YlzJ-like family protein [Anaerotruncus colihominis]|uniref:YlzJ-like family protein n=1 Tax=Anaerotruncus colihominis TaxID=169435 RepID=UPI0026EE8C39|nr:YlzJ-like family protein [Anaerotruncus colihominis]
MILHTIIPPEQIFPGDAPQGSECRRMHNNFIQGVNMNGIFTVSRLISTDPKLYLDPRYAPGGRVGKQK